MYVYVCIYMYLYVCMYMYVSICMYTHLKPSIQPGNGSLRVLVTMVGRIMIRGTLSL